MEQALIGVDIGTSSIKAVAFSRSGHQLAKATTPTVTHYPRPDWAEYDPSALWDAMSGVLRRLMRDLPAGAAPVSIAFTSMAETAVPLDEQGQPVHAAIAWFDRRTTPQADWWQETIGGEYTASITGLPVKNIFGILKLIWIREHAPDAFARTHCWLNMADYGVFRLCGAQATDYSLASRMLVLDLAQRRWSQPLLDAIEIPKTLLGDLVPSGVLLGQVTSEAAAATGLPQGLPVCSGGHDHVCGALALGIVDPGDVFDSMGTAESLFIATRQPNLDPMVMQRGIGQGIHVVPERSYAMGGVHFAGGAIDWVRQLLFDARGTAGLNLDSGEEAHSFEALIDLARAVPPGSGGICFLPHLRLANPPINDPMSRGAFIGISSDATPGHFARAVLEGLAYEYQRAYDSMIEMFRLSPRRLLASGGGTRNDLLLEIKAMVAGQPVVVPDIEEATCLGAAMLGGIGAGIYNGFSDATEQIQYATQAVESDAAMHAFYQERYHKLYVKLYDMLKEANHLISGWMA